MPIKPLLAYPNHPEFEELLNSCGSMTRQLEDLGQKLSVTLLHTGTEGNYFCRYTTLNLNNKSVVIACSSAKITDIFFVNLLKKASTTPIGKYLFAPGSEVKRQDNMHLKLINISQISQSIIIENLAKNHYQTKQQFWQRTSFFEYQLQRLRLIEILLPELDSFF